MRPAEKLPEALGEGAADVVISTEMLEHAEYWRAAMAGMVGFCPGGTLLLTTRRRGSPPSAPGRLLAVLGGPDAQIVAACGLDVPAGRRTANTLAGVFLLARKPAGWDGAGMAEALGVLEPGPPR